MATRTLGTISTTALTAVLFQPGMAPSDVNAIATAVKGDGLVSRLIRPGAFDQTGLLYLPGGRGIVKCKAGDYVAVDSFGWPVVISANSIASGGTSWSHT